MTKNRIQKLGIGAENILSVQTNITLPIEFMYNYTSVIDDSIMQAN